MGRLFSWNNQTKLIVGNKNLAKPLRKAGYKVKIFDLFIYDVEFEKHDDLEVI